MTRAQPKSVSIRISITGAQRDQLQRRIRQRGTGTLSSEIGRAIDQYLASSKQIAKAFLRELKNAKPNDLSPLSTLEKKLEKTMRGLDQTMAKLKVSEQRMEALARLDFSAVGRLAYEVFGSADKASAWFERSNRALAGKTPFSVLTTASGYKRVEALLKRIDHGVQG